jgi:hypothetical protein
VVEVPVAFFRPDASLQLLAGDQDAGALQQNLKNLEGLVLKLDTASRFTNLSGQEISLKRSTESSGTRCSPLVPRL